MAYEIQFSDTARDETDRAYLFLSRHSPEAALRWLNGLDTALASRAESLEVLPRRRLFAPENDLFPDVNVFQLLYGRGMNAYRFRYHLTDADENGTVDTLRVLHVRHGAQQRLGEDTPDNHQDGL